MGIIISRIQLRCHRRTHRNCTIAIFELQNKIRIYKYFAYVYTRPEWLLLVCVAIAVAMASETATLFASLHSIIIITHPRTGYSTCVEEARIAHYILDAHKDLLIRRKATIQNCNVLVHWHNASAQLTFIRCSAFQCNTTEPMALCYSNKIVAVFFRCEINYNLNQDSERQSWVRAHGEFCELCKFTWNRWPN